MQPTVASIEIGGQEMLTAYQAAEALGVNDSRVRQILRAGELTGVKIAGVWLISRQELERYKQSRGERKS